jgi:TolB-like protein
MNKKTGDNSQTAKEHRRWAFSGRSLLALAGALVVILALVIGLNVGGLREELMWRINPPRIESLAVLPLENLSHDPEQESLATAMTQALLTDLQRIGAFPVIANQSVTGYKKAPKPLPEIARELNIDAAVQGSVLRSGDRVRFFANLIHAATNRHLWGQTFERDMTEILRLQADVSRAIALEIKGKLSPQQEARLAGRRTVNPQAFEAYLGAFAGDPAKSQVSLRRVIQLDPMFAHPYDMTASRLYMRNMFPTLAPRDTYPAAKEAAQKAISLDPTISQSHRILALAALEYDWNIAEAEKEFKLALEAAPYGAHGRHYHAHLLLSMGRIEEAKAEGRRAMELNPKDPALFACLSWHDIAEHNYEQAEKRSLQALSMGAPDQLARLTLGWSYALRDRHDEAIAEFQKAVVGWKGAVFPTATLGHGYAVAGQQAAAREVLDKLLVRSKTGYVSPYEIAVIYAGMGDKDRAFEWLEKAYEERVSLLVYFRMDPRIWSLRSDARFQELLRRMNFPEDRR